MRYFCVFLLSPFFLSAQSEFIDNASFAVKADFVFSLNKDFSGMGGNIGISLSSVFDIGFEYTKVSYEPKYNIESYSRMVYAGYNFRSKNNCLKVFLGYSHNSVNIRHFNFSILEVTGPLLGFIVSPKIYDNKSIGLLPSLSFSMAFLSASDNLLIGIPQIEIVYFGEFQLIPLNIYWLIQKYRAMGISK